MSSERRGFKNLMNAQNQQSFFEAYSAGTVDLCLSNWSSIWSPELPPLLCSCLCILSVKGDGIPLACLVWVWTGSNWDSSKKKPSLLKSVFLSKRVS